MKNIKVPCIGCANCKTALKPIEEAAEVYAGGVPGRDRIAGWL